MLKSHQRATFVQPCLAIVTERPSLSSGVCTGALGVMEQMCVFTHSHTYTPPYPTPYGSSKPEKRGFVKGSLTGALSPHSSPFVRSSLGGGGPQLDSENVCLGGFALTL